MEVYAETMLSYVVSNLVHDDLYNTRSVLKDNSSLL